MDNDFPSNEVNYIDFDRNRRFEKKPYKFFGRSAITFFHPVFFLLVKASKH